MLLLSELGLVLHSHIQLSMARGKQMEMTTCFVYLPDQKFIILSLMVVVVMDAQDCL